MFQFPSRPTVISLTALVVALGGAAFSATGGNFILGVINSAENQSGIVSPVNGKMLLLNNTSTSANATALGLTVKPGHPPMVVNSDVKVPQLNADKLDGLTSSEFARTFAFKNTDLVSATLVAGTNFVLAPAFTPTSSGRCLVAVSSQISFGGAGTAETGPFYRAAVKRGAAAAVSDGEFGHYFPPAWGSSAFNIVTPDLTRVSSFDVTAGEVTQLGAFFGGVAGAFVGKSANVNVAYYCETLGSESGPLAVATRSGAPVADMAAIQQDRQAAAR